MPDCQAEDGSQGLSIVLFPALSLTPVGSFLSYGILCGLWGAVHALVSDILLACCSWPILICMLKVDFSVS